MYRARYPPFRPFLHRYGHTRSIPVGTTTPYYIVEFFFPGWTRSPKTQQNSPTRASTAYPTEQPVPTKDLPIAAFNSRRVGLT